MALSNDTPKSTPETAPVSEQSPESLSTGDFLVQREVNQFRGSGYSPGAFTPGSILGLQRTIGNQATVRIIQREMADRKSRSEIQRAALDAKPLSGNKEAVHSWKPAKKGGGAPSAVPEAAQPLVVYGSEGEVTANFNKITVEEFRSSPSLQGFVFKLANVALANQKSKAEGILSGLGIQKAQIKASAKRDNVRDFAKGVLTKCDEKPYKLLHEMTDMARGRFEVANGGDSAKIFEKLKPDSPKQFTLPREDKETGVIFYPRYHAIVNDPTGIPFEWQIGTYATSYAMETSEIVLPPTLISTAKAAGKNVHKTANLHDISYAVFGRMLKSDNLMAVRVAKKNGLDDFNNRVALAYQKSGEIGETSEVFKKQMSDLLNEASKLLNELVNSGNSSIMVPFLH